MDVGEEEGDETSAVGREMVMVEAKERYDRFSSALGAGVWTTTLCTDHDVHNDGIGQQFLQTKTKFVIFRSKLFKAPSIAVLDVLEDIYLSSSSPFATMLPATLPNACGISRC